MTCLALGLATGGRRGLLSHDYTMGTDGRVNLTVGSTHNDAAMNLSVMQLAPQSESCTLTLAQGTF